MMSREAAAPGLSPKEQHFVYVVRCANGTLYVGYTTNVARRVATHNAGRGGSFTRRNRPVSLIATWSFNRRCDALAAERALKRMSLEKKVAMIETASTLGSDE
jgi:putative endonuclease